MIGTLRRQAIPRNFGVRRLGLRAAAFALALVACLSLHGATRAAGGQAGVWKIYAPGWNLVAAPDGARLALHGEELLQLDGSGGDYTVSDAPLAAAGSGYWVYYPQGAMLLLVGTPQDVSQVHVDGGSWATLGNSGMKPAAVRGADLALTYDPDAGYKQVSIVQPGQAALVYADSDADVFLDPFSVPPAVVPMRSRPSTAPVPQMPASAGPSGSSPADELNYLFGLGPLLTDVDNHLGSFADNLDVADPMRPGDPVWQTLRDDADAVTRDLTSLRTLGVPARYRAVHAELVQALTDISDGMHDTIDGLLNNQPQRVSLGAGLLASGARRLAQAEEQLPS
jgi:hypothetical protein